MEEVVTAEETMGVMEELMVMELVMVEVELPVVETVEPVMVEAMEAEMRSPTAMVAEAEVASCLPRRGRPRQREDDKCHRDYRQPAHQFSHHLRDHHLRDHVRPPLLRFTYAALIHR